MPPSALRLYEVFKRILQQRDAGQALQAVALMQQARVAELTAPLAHAAASVSLRYIAAKRAR